MPKLTSVLLVDDDSTTNFLAQALLRREAITESLFIAENGQEALRVLHEHCPALILLDVNMPVMNGFEFLEAYQQLPLHQRRAKILVMLTTALLPHDLERLQRLPVAGVLTKPLTKEKIAALLAQYFPAALGA